MITLLDFPKYKLHPVCSHMKFHFDFNGTDVTKFKEKLAREKVRPAELILICECSLAGWKTYELFTALL